MKGPLEARFVGAAGTYFVFDADDNIQSERALADAYNALAAAREADRAALREIVEKNRAPEPHDDWSADGKLYFVCPLCDECSTVSREEVQHDCDCPVGIAQRRLEEDGDG